MEKFQIIISNNTPSNELANIFKLLKTMLIFSIKYPMDLNMTNKTSFCYKDAGIDIDATTTLVNQIKKIAKKTYRSEFIGYSDGFSALCAIPEKYHEPVLVSSTDGIGTKLRIAIDAKRHDVIGIDLVAMCVNDLIVHGAEPLFFLNYYATGKLDTDVVINIMNSIVEGCLQSNCILIGGETAEMPGIYRKKDYDVAGFCLGIVEKSKIIDKRKVIDGDILIALSSSGLHSNGYSLVRKIIEINNLDLLTFKLEKKPLIDHLLIPTRIYVNTILSLIKIIDIHAIAHLTGGGFWWNIPRILPDNTQAIINESSWKWPVIFDWLQKSGNISRYEMYRTFNCGVGMIIVLPSNQKDKALKLIKDKKEKAWVIGEIKSSNSKERVVFI